VEPPRSVNGLTGSGLKWGYGFTGGMALHPERAVRADGQGHDDGHRHPRTYIFAEYNYDKLDDFGKVGLNLSARYFTFGLGFEF
jgi:hypothetical protein